MFSFETTTLILLFSYLAPIFAQLYGNGGIGPAPIVPLNKRYGYGVGGYGGGGYGGAGYGGAGYGLNPYDCLPGAYGGGSAGYNNNFYKPSYAYQTLYGGGGGLSGYEGPYGGYTTYTQPGISYPPLYGGILNSGYYGSGNINGIGSNSYGGASNYGSGGLSSGGNGIGLGAAGCRDRSAECSLLASTGQCSNSANVRSLCPISCGTGCTGAEALLGGDLYGGVNPALYGSSAGIGAGAGSLDYGNNNDYGGTPLECRDSHIQGCQNWAQLGYCSSVPEFMLSYCKASCGVCSGGNNGFPPGYSYAGYPASNGAFPLGGTYSTYLNPSLNGARNNIGNNFNSGISSGLPLGGYINTNPISGGDFNDALFLQQLGGSLSGTEQLSGFNGGSAFPGPAGLGGGVITPFPYSPYYPSRVNSVFAEKREPKSNSVTRQVASSSSMDPPAGMAAALTSGSGSTLSDKMSTVLRMDQIGA